MPSSDSPLIDSEAVDASASVVLVCAPPLLPMVTPDATWVLEDVAPDVCVVSVAVVPLPVDVDPLLVDVESAPVAAVEAVSVAVLDVAADSLDDSPADAELDELVVDDSEDVPVVSAAANP